MAAARRSNKASHPRGEMRVLGLMSGTSADGIDAALVRISGKPPALTTRLEGFYCRPLLGAARAAILRVAGGAPTTTAEIARLNVLLGEIFAQAALSALRHFGVSPRSVDLIGSHGQTVYHQGNPETFLAHKKIAATLQIGEPAIIAERTGIATIADFRPADLAAGGQGAPLVPFADYLLYRHAKRGRVALNVGGIANITVIPAAARPGEVFAFDTGPGNMLIDALVQWFSDGRLRYDRDAGMARGGRLEPSLLASLLEHPYFRVRPPKSAGREQFGHSFAQRALDWVRKSACRPEDALHTTTLLTPLTILEAMRRWVLPRVKVDDLIVSGGGAHNPVIVSQLAAGLPGVEILRAGELGVPEDAKEAFAFAVLAYESYHGRPANLPGATGASHPVILGKLCRPGSPLRATRRRSPAR
jgi:anhydro-N-acetylmuramic acid kinase